MRKPRILFLAEHVTWSQVVRLLVLARGLAPSWEVHFACASFDEALFRGESFVRHGVESISPAQVDRALARGTRIYDRATLSRYVDEERRLFDRIEPDVVVADLRWSTTISAPLAGVPLASLVNAYWSARTVRDGWPMPDHPIVRLLGPEIAARGYEKARPFVFRHFAAPVNALRKAHRLPEIGDLEDVLLFGDRVLFPDDPSVVPLSSTRPNEIFLGPILWSPEIAPPPELDRLGRDRPLVYATLGSSGDLRVMPTVLEALGRLPVDVLLSTAKRFVAGAVPPNVTVAPMVPGDLVARRAAVVVCNGGASTGYQALAEGTPIVGIPSNLDAWLSMTAIRDAGAGVLLRAGGLKTETVTSAIERVLAEGSFRERAQWIAKSFGACDPHARFLQAIAELAQAERGAPSEAHHASAGAR
jgi:UDP:flavonoid glycosyltransferase YjiC (YdhE family)